MGCYRPLLGQRCIDNSTGALSVKVCGRFDRDAWKHPGNDYDYIRDQLQDDIFGILKIPCGKCIGCRLDYSRTWADRCMIELDHSKVATFCTLTYDDMHLRFNDRLYPTLFKKDLQDFFKRLRDHFPGKSIRYFVSGEYGPTTLRPHYHAIIFGLSLNDFPDLIKDGSNKLHEPYYTSKKFSNIWDNGFVQMSNVSWRTCAYCSRYVAKKVTDFSAYLDLSGVTPPFALMSRRPGLGGFWLEEHPDTDIESKIYLNDIFTHKATSSCTLPSYIFDKLASRDRDAAEQLIHDRQIYSDDRLLIELSKTDLSYLEYQANKEADKEVQVKALARNKL